MRNRALCLLAVWMFASLGTLGCARPTAVESADTPVAAVANQPTPQAQALLWPPGKLIDLTHPFDQATLFWPTSDTFALRKDFAGVTEKGYYYASNTFTTAEHGGTHTDAPIHFFKDRQTVDQIPLDRLFGDAVIIDVREKCAADRDYQVSVGDLRAWEEKHSRQLVDVIVLLRTGFAAHWPDAQKYLGTTERGADAVKKLSFPGLDPVAAKWLAEERKVKAVGIDTASIDHGPSTHFGSHVALCGGNIPIFENVKLNDELPPVGFHVVALPIKIGGGSGGPTRIVAIAP